MKKNLQLFVIAVFLTGGIGICQESSLSFDGNDFIEVPEISDVTGAAARTVDAWIKVPLESNSEQVLVQWGNDAPQEKWTIRLNGGSVLRVEHGAGATFGTTELNNDSWRHVAVTLAADAPLSEAKLYVDGVEETYSQQGGDVCNTSSHIIWVGKANTKVSDGDKPIPVRHWKGLIDELRIWKAALSPEEILAIKDSTLCVDDHPDLVAYYSFSESDGTTAVDATGNFDGLFGGNVDSTNLHPTWETVGAPVAVKDCGGGVFVENSSYTQISLYPNPASDVILIHSEAEIESVMIFDITGKEVLQRTNPGNNQLDVSSLEEGLYFVSFRTSGNLLSDTQKLIIK